MNDYTYPSVYFAYFFFLIVACGAVYFFLRSRRDGYWGKESEDVKYRMLIDDDNSSQRSQETPFPGDRLNQ
ncbi:MAG: hypothetical protein ABL999_04865 [Pyrinomonadaceae bacterium]